jgi:hypothetical protein
MTTQINLRSIDMYRGNGYGQYSIVAIFDYQGETHRVKIYSTDSQLWDADERTPEMLLDAIGGEDALLSRI